MTDAERQRRRYARRKAGLVRVEVWVPADREATVLAAIQAVLAEEQPENVGTHENHVGTHEK